MTPRLHISGIGDAPTTTVTTSPAAGIPVGIVSGVLGPTAGMQVAANIAAPQTSCSGLTAVDAEGDCTLKQWCAEAAWYNPVAIAACIGYDIGNVAGTVVANAQGAPELPGPTVVPGTGVPQVPSNYSKAAGGCVDSSGNYTTCSTNTPASTIQYQTPDPAANCTQAGYTYDPETGSCTQPTTNYALYAVIGVAAIVLIMRMTK